ncbi:MAG: excinuclease ABC subunit UvrA [Verrucomicrobiota bacterium]
MNCHHTQKQGVKNDSHERGFISIQGARQHNLKNLSLKIPKNKLTVITGPSGSGKSSLAFDTLFAEGQRRYINSLSSYARQFLDKMEKPDVDIIDGLSPAVAIEQRSGSNSPRSTVATVTEILDYLRILYATSGKAHHPETGKPLQKFSSQEIVDKILSQEEGMRFVIASPLVSQDKGHHKALFQQLRRDGFVRVRVDGKMYSLDEEIATDKEQPHDIEVIIDRLKVTSKIQNRLSQSVELALDKGQGVLTILWLDNEQKIIDQWHLSNQNFDPETGFVFPTVTPRHFSFNSPLGACPTCSGLGTEAILDNDLIIPDHSLSLEDGAILPWKKAPVKLATHYQHLLRKLAEYYKVSMTSSWKDLPESFQHVLLYGSGARTIPQLNQSFVGIRQQLEELYNDSSSSTTRQRIHAFMTHQTCRACRGSRLRPEICAVTLGNNHSEFQLSLHELCDATVENAESFLKKLHWSGNKADASEDLCQEVLDRLRFLKDVGLGYLTLNRETGSLSGGELQRIRLAGQLGAGLTGVLYVLDEPSIGLHQRDNERLLQTIENLRDLGNTVVVVEHDEDTMERADYIIDLGPVAGPRGGYLVAEGTPGDIANHPKSTTGRYLSKQESLPIPEKRKPLHKGFLNIINARENNLGGINVSFPIGCFTCVTGVSGSGKSTLVNEVLSKALFRHFFRSKDKPGRHDKITGLDELDKVVTIDQSPIGRTPRSNPLTYIGAFNLVRDLYAQLPSSRIRGYTKNRFSFNTAGGRCEHCKGDGYIRLAMHFLPDVFVECEHCKGQRFNRETLEITYKGHHIAHVLNLTVDEGIDLFSSIPAITEKLEALSKVGLGYLKLGQPSNTLSGGEAQRIKLATEFSKKTTGHTCFIMDEPTTGLHLLDIEYLLRIIFQLREAGNTIIVIEHHLDIIKSADYVIDLGPEGGNQGGQVVCVGAPEEIAKCKESYTGSFLKRKLQM